MRRVPWAILGLVVLVPVVAAKSYDGDYTLRYAFNDPYSGGVVENSITDVSISGSSVTGWLGQIYGSVDEFGGIDFTGPCPQNNVGDQARYTGVFADDEYASGQYDCGGSASGSWSITCTGGCGGGFLGIPTEALVFLAVAVPLSILMVVGVNAAKKRQRMQTSMGRVPAPSTRLPSRPAHGRPAEFLTSQPSPPNVSSAPDAPFITADGSAYAMREQWAEVGPPNGLPLVEGPGWNGVGTGRVLAWAAPATVPPGNALIGFRVIELRYGPGSTAPQENVVANLLPANTAFLPPPQTFWSRTGGDILGYRIQAVFSDAAGATLLGPVTTVLPW